MQASIICNGCKNPIVDSYLLHIEGNEYWHEHCLQCCECCDKLIRVCYKKNGDIFCKYDYNRLFGTKCVACSNLISPNSVIMKVLDTNLFHIDCFKCEECGNKLEKGDEFVFKDKKLFCRADLNAMEQKSDVDVFSSSSDETGSISTASPSSYEKNASGCKRPRTILTTQQRHNFKTAFELAPKPCRKVREKLSKETGLSVRVVQVWFQNQRAKLKKLHRKVDNGKKPEIHKTNVGKPSSKKTPSPKNFPLTPEDFNKISESNVTSSSPVSTFLPSREMKNINTRSIPPVHKPLQKTSIFMVSDHDTTLNQPTNTLDIAAAKYNTGHNNSSMGNNFGENGFHGSMNNNNNNDLVTRNNHVFAHASTNQFHSKHVHPPSASQFHLMPHLINAYL